jgi:hypothetical protein
MTQADSVLSTPPTNTSADTTLERPADSAGALYVKTPVTPEEIFCAIGRLRKEARDEIDRLIRFLDSTENHMAIDCKPEDEDGVGEDAEPSLGSFDRMTDQSKAWQQRSEWAFLACDAEQDDCDREDDDPNEAKRHPPEMAPRA